MHGGPPQNGRGALPSSQDNPTRRSARLQESSQHSEVRDLQNRLDGFQRQNQSLKAKLEMCRNRLQGCQDKNRENEQRLDFYLAAIQDKSLECHELKDKMEELEQASAGNQGTGWSLRNILPGPACSQKPDNDELENLRAKLARRETYIASLQDEIRTLNQRMERQAQQMQAQTIEFAQELDDVRKKALVKVPKLSDTEIQGEWKTIGCLIRQFILKYLRDPLDLPTIGYLAQRDLFKWLPDMVRTLQFPMLRPAIMESWIWHFLCFRVFDSQSHLWAGSVGTTFSSVGDQIRGE